jgi:hypothetical protein
VCAKCYGRDLATGRLATFAVELRYDLEFSPSQVEASEACDLAAHVIDAVGHAIRAE